MSTEPHSDDVNPSGDPDREASAPSGGGFVGGDQDGWQAPGSEAFTGASSYPPQGAPGYGSYQTPPVGQPGYGADGGQGHQGYQGYTDSAGYGAGYASYPGAAGYPGYGGNPSALAPKPSIIPLRPLSIGEILGGAFESLRANPKAMFVPSLAVMTIVGLISAAGSVYSLNRLGTTSLYSSSGQPSDTDVQKQLSSLLELYAQSAISSILTMLASSILTGLLIVTVSRTILGRKASLGDVWQRTKPRVWALIGQAVIIQLILSAVMAAAIGIWVAVVFALGVPGMVEGSSRQGAAATVLLAFLGLFILIVLVGLGVFALYCKLCLAPAALILENVGVFEGISRSWTLTRGNFWRIVGIQLLSVIIIVFATGIATTPVSLLAGILAATVPSVETLTLAFSVLLGTIVTAATLPFDSAVRALIYTDLRMRSEGLDVELRRAAGV